MVERDKYNLFVFFALLWNFAFLAILRKNGATWGDEI